VVLMEATGSRIAESPLASLVRAQVDRVLQSWEASGTTPAEGTAKSAVRRFLAALDELAQASDALAAGPRAVPAGEAPVLPTILAITDDPLVASGLRQRLGASSRFVAVSSPREATDAATGNDPAVLFAAGRAAGEAVSRVREMFPGLPAVIAAPESEVPKLLADFQHDPAVVLPVTVGPDGFAGAIRALLEQVAPLPAPAEGAAEAGDAARPAGELAAEPRSYAHLTGMLPRALERTLEFDVGAAVIARPGGEPLVDVHATSECPASMLEAVRENALALFSIVSGRVQREGEELRVPVPAPLRSAIYVPLATEGRVVGLTYLGSFRPDAFSRQGDVIGELASHASGAYRRLEASVSRLRLTPRQSQVLALIASGLSDKEVAERLGLAHRTVRTHVDRLLREHGLRSRTEAVAAWLRGQQG
jgi:DNA-binding NarL/FixJ family response regulator